jgi:hypothetical protein
VSRGGEIGYKGVGDDDEVGRRQIAYEERVIQTPLIVPPLFKFDHVGTDGRC